MASILERRSIFLYAIIGVAVSSMASATWLVPEFYQVYGLVIPQVSSGKVAVQSGSQVVEALIKDGKFGYAPNLIKVNGADGDVVMFSINGLNLANQSFKQRGISFVTLRLPQDTSPRESIVGTVPHGLVASIDGLPLRDRNLSGFHTFALGEAGEKPSIIVKLDLSSATINLSLIKYETTSTGRGAGAISGLSLPGGVTKAVRFPRIAGGNEVCIRDQESAGIASVSNDCRGSGEVRLFCDAVFNFGYRCTIEQDDFFVEGLYHSAFAEIVPGAQGSGSANQTTQSQAKTASHAVIQNITIQKYRINLSNTAQIFELDLRDAVEFVVGGERILMIHMGTGKNNATFKVLPSGFFYEVVSQTPERISVNQDDAPDVELILQSTSFDNATVSFALPSHNPIEPSKPPVLPVPPVPPSTPSLPPQPLTTPSHMTIPALANETKTSVLVRTSKEIPAVKAHPSRTAPTQAAVEFPRSFSPSFSVASMVAFAKVHEWVLPTLFAILAVVLAMIGYAAYLLVKELRAVKEITAYITKSLALGFPLPQIMQALRGQGWSSAHIQKSLSHVATSYAEVSRANGKPPETIRAELEGKGWPQDVIANTLPRSGPRR